jgi:O-antigen/teichoic acid export membrane protein
MNIKISQITSRIPFLLSFLFTKGTVFVTPLLLADLLDVEVFGKLEYAIAGLGFVLSAIVNMGVPSAYPYFLLKKKEEDVAEGFTGHFVWLGAFFLLNQLAFTLFNLSLEIYTSLNIAFIIANQIWYSTRLKTHEKPVRAIFFDSGLYILLLILFAVIKLGVIEPSFKVISIVFFVYGTLYFFEGSRRFWKSKKIDLWAKYRRILKYSLNVMLGSFFIFLLTASGRILVEFFFSYEDVAVYAYFFRISAGTVVLYQMISILFFAKLYTYPPAKLDFYFSLFFLSTAFISLALFFALPYILERLSLFFSTVYPSERGVYFILSIQMIMWIATALNSSIIDRENLAKTNNICFLGLLFGFSIVLWILKGKFLLEDLVFVHMTVIFVAALIQYRNLKRKKILFKRSTFALLIIYLFAAFGYGLRTFSIN